MIPLQAWQQGPMPKLRCQRNQALQPQGKTIWHCGEITNFAKKVDALQQMSLAEVPFIRPSSPLTSTHPKHSPFHVTQSSSSQSDSGRAARCSTCSSKSGGSLDRQAARLGQLAPSLAREVALSCLLQGGCAGLGTCKAKSQQQDDDCYALQACAA